MNLFHFGKKKILLIILFAWYFTAERSVWWSYNWPWMYIDQISHLPNFEGIWSIKWTTQTHNFPSLKKTFINAGYSNDYFKHYHYFLYYPFFYCTWILPRETRYRLNMTTAGRETNRVIICFWTLCLIKSVKVCQRWGINCNWNLKRCIKER